MVVGAGIAGLEAASTAAARGHTVTVLGRSEAVGGKTRLLASLPLGESLSSIYDYQQLAATRSGVQVRTYSALQPAKNEEIWSGVQSSPRSLA